MPCCLQNSKKNNKLTSTKKEDGKVFNLHSVGTKSHTDIKGIIQNAIKIYYVQGLSLIESHPIISSIRHSESILFFTVS